MSAYGRLQSKRGLRRIDKKEPDLSYDKSGFSLLLHNVFLPPLPSLQIIKHERGLRSILNDFFAAYG